MTHAIYRGQDGTQQRMVHERRISISTLEDRLTAKFDLSLLEQLQIAEAFIMEREVQRIKAYGASRSDILRRLLEISQMTRDEAAVIESEDEDPQETPQPPIRQRRGNMSAAYLREGF